MNTAGEVRGAQLSNRRKAGAAFFIALPHKKARLGQPPVLHPQTRQLAVRLLCVCFFFFASARSFASPCGPCGLGSINTNTDGVGCCSWIGGTSDFSQSNPKDDIALTSALAASSWNFSPVLLTTTPTFSLPLVPSATGPSRIFSIGSGSVGVQFADLKAVAKSDPKLKASTSVVLYSNQVRLTRKLLSSLSSVSRSLGVNLRQEIESSSSTRANRSSSASLTNPAALAFNAAASAFNPATRFSEIFSICSAASAARDPKRYSPYTPPAIAIPARTVNTFSHRFNSFHFGQSRMVYSTRRPAKTATVHQPARALLLTSVDLRVSRSGVPNGVLYFVIQEQRRRLTTGLLAVLAMLPGNILSPWRLTGLGITFRLSPGGREVYPLVVFVKARLAPAEAECASTRSRACRTGNRI
jgi:hypothetical protein